MAPLSPYQLSHPPFQLAPLRWASGADAGLPPDLG